MPDEPLPTQHDLRVELRKTVLSALKTDVTSFVEEIDGADAFDHMRQFFLDETEFYTHLGRLARVRGQKELDGFFSTLGNYLHGIYHDLCARGYHGPDETVHHREHRRYVLQEDEAIYALTRRMGNIDAFSEISSDRTDLVYRCIRGHLEDQRDLYRALNDIYELKFDTQVTPFTQPTEFFENFRGTMGVITDRLEELVRPRD